MKNVFLRIPRINQVSLDHLVELLRPSHKDPLRIPVDIVRDIVLVPSRVLTL